MAPHKYYTVGVSNQFAAFGLSGGESSDEGEVILSSPPVVESTKESTGIATFENKSIKKDGTPHKTSNRGQQQRPENTRVMNTRGRGGGVYTPQRNKEISENENDISNMTRRPRGRGRGRGNFAARGGREFDRHSGMGKPRDNAKGGGGGHNWGKEDEHAEVREEVRETSTPQEEGIENTNQENQETVEDISLKKENAAIDYETYKLMMSERRANLPNFAHPESQKQITTDKELEAQGYKIHLKETTHIKSTAEESLDDEDEENQMNEENIKKKSISVYEYIQQEGGRVNMFSSRRGRGGRGGDERRYFKGGRRGGRSKDAPDIQDTRAFPSLGA